MIEWVLEQLEFDPHRRFSQRELEERGPSEFEVLRSDGLLRREALPAGLLQRTVRGRAVLYAPDRAGVREGFDLDDPDDDPIPFELEETAIWTLNLRRLTEGLRTLHRLNGEARALTDRLHLLGERGAAEAREVIALAFVRGNTALGHLATLPLLLDGHAARIAVLAPSYRPSAGDRELLRRGWCHRRASERFQ